MYNLKITHLSKYIARGWGRRTCAVPVDKFRDGTKSIFYRRESLIFETTVNAKVRALAARIFGVAIAVSPLGGLSHHETPSLEAGAPASPHLPRVYKEARQPRMINLVHGLRAGSLSWSTLVLSARISQALPDSVVSTRGSTPGPRTRDPHRYHPLTPSFPYLPEPPLARKLIFVSLS